MIKIIRNNSHVTVVLSNGDLLARNDCDDEMYNLILEFQEDEKAIKEIMAPEFAKKRQEALDLQSLAKDMEKSGYLDKQGSSMYIPRVSEVSVPQDLALALFRAEQENDDELINTYINFWTLCCLNPDSRARNNLFWFLNKYGMVISKSGLFVAYRNVKVKQEGTSIDLALSHFISTEYTRIKFVSKKSPKNYLVYRTEDGEFKVTEERNVAKPWFQEANHSVIGNLLKLYTSLSDTSEQTTVFTDGHTGKMTIQMGRPVSMKREDCDPNQDNTCSSGLHVAGRTWIKRNQFGNTTIMVLVNPADVVAVPPSDNYGKMRTCAYYPVKTIERDELGEIKFELIPDGFEDDFFDMISYRGEINNEEVESPYRLEIPSIPELSSSRIDLRLSEIKNQLKSKLL